MVFMEAQLCAAKLEKIMALNEHQAGAIANADAQLNNAALANYSALLEILKAAVLRVELSNKEGNPILSAWLPDAQAVLAAVA